ncbi:unnamed protein product [Prorocentrum cordatum]|uniref:RRM domain-containing protein n=1 Tax=Prorocentrum cordatum TaxID=2364126 RepID=A0ABN9Y127_9DINO|nr:unnamed protein product [Polarella glacialis]
MPGGALSGSAASARCAARWLSEALLATNSLHGHGAPRQDLQVSRAQLAGIDRVREIIREAGPPPFSGTAAHAEPCSHLPGYAEDTARRASYSEGLVSLPTMGGQCVGADCLTGRALELWVGWQKHLLREEGPPDGPRLRPFSDPKLVHGKKTHARFIGELLVRGLIDLGERTEPTVGIFFVCMSDKRSLRMIADTRVANMRFRPPAHSEPPTAGAWSSLAVPEGKSLHLAQMDVDNAFYRIATPPGLRDHFVPLAVDLDVLRAERPDLSAQLLPGRKASPRLAVLAMGWNWSPLFCQQSAETQVLRSGLAWERLALYVDGAAVIGLDYTETMATAQRARESLGAVGLRCKVLEGPCAEATFTGLVFDEARGRAELRIAAALVVFSYVDCRRQADPVALATDACGATDADAGGFGAAERWRYRVSEAAAARAHALGLSERPHVPDSLPPPSGADKNQSPCSQGSCILAKSTPLARPPHPVSDFERTFGDMYSGTVSFEQITSEHVGPLESWLLRVKGRFSRAENIIRLEGHGVVIGIRHHLRAASRRGRKLLALCDNLGLVLALGKGWAAGPRVNKTCREAAALSIFGDMSVTVRWIPSELNLADRPSRMAGALARDPRADPRSACFDPAAAPLADAPAALAAAVDEALLGGELDGLGRPRVGLAGLGDALLDDPLPGGAARLRAEAAAGCDAWGGQSSARRLPPAGRRLTRVPLPALGGQLTAPQARVAERIGRRATLRRATAALAAPARSPGSDLALSFLESRRVTDKSRDTLGREEGAFRAWCLEQRKDVSSRAALDETLVEYLDCLYFDGYNHERGDKLLSGLAFKGPKFRRGGELDLARARAALQGFRRLAPGQARMPLPRPEFAVVAMGLDFGISLAIAWDGGLRLPSDIMSLQGRRPGRSKAGHKGEGLLLDGVFTRGIEPQLWRLKRAAGDSGSLWTFTAAEFRAGFKRAAAMIGRPPLRPCQVRHGAASDDALYQRRSLAEIQERLRHACPKSTLRYKKHTRYLAELGKAPPRVRAYGEAVEAQAAALLNGRVALLPPRDLAATGPLTAAAIRAGLSESLLKELGDQASCYLDIFSGLVSRLFDAVKSGARINDCVLIAADLDAELGSRECVAKESLLSNFTRVAQDMNVTDGLSEMSQLVGRAARTAMVAGYRRAGPEVPAEGALCIASSPGPRGGDGCSGDDSGGHRIFVSALPEECTNEELEHLATQLDLRQPLELCRILDCWTIEGKGCGYLRFASREAAQVAIEELSGRKVTGWKKALNATWARPPPRGRDRHRAGDVERPAADPNQRVSLFVGQLKRLERCSEKEKADFEVAKSLDPSEIITQAAALQKTKVHRNPSSLDVMRDELERREWPPAYTENPICASARDDELVIPLGLFVDAARYGGTSG